MNDKLIINAISKLHFITVSVIFFIFLTLSSLFVILQNGVYIKNISLPNVQVEKLYIKWNEKLNIKAKKIKITTKTENENSNLNISKINKIFKFLILFDEWFEEINILKISFKDMNATFKYEYAKNGYLNLISKDFSLKTSLYFNEHLFVTKINSFHDIKRNIDAEGYIVANLKGDLQIYSSIKLNINNDIKLNIYANMDKTKLRYKVKPLDKIKSINHTMQMIDMPQEVRYWAYKAIKTSYVDLKYAYGWVDFNNSKDFIKNIRVLATANNLQYTYNPKLKPVITKETELEFKDGTLFIRPHDAYQYGFYLNKSWLKIDFSKKEELLTLFLLFKGKVNKDLLHLLNTYKIKLPFLQNTGNVDTDLKIEVNLRNIDVTAKGEFFTKKANFHYLGLDIDIFNAKIFLDNYNVKIHNMLTKYKNIATAYVDVNFNAKDKEGLVNLNFKDIALKDIDLKLNHHKLLNIKYKISKVQDYINMQKSNWTCKGINFEVSKLNLPFNLKKLNTTIPNTYIKSKNINANLYGTLSLAPIKLNINLKLSKLKIKNIKLNQKKVLFKIKYDKNLTIKSNKSINLKIDNLKSTISQLSLNFKQKNLNLLDTNFKIKNILDMDLNAQYNFKNKNTTINLKKINLRNNDLGGIFYSQKNIKLYMKSYNNQTDIWAKELSMHSTFKKDNWEFQADALSKIYNNSKILRDYNITNGQLSIFQNTPKKINFKLKTNFIYKFLISNNKPIENYTLKGDINIKNKNISLSLNDLVDVKIKDNIKINTENTSLNIKDILNYVQDNTPSNKQQKNQKKIFFNAKNSNIYISKDRRIISEDINLTYKNNITEASLKYKKGYAKFQLNNDKIFLIGNLFNDEFMNNLFALSKFKGGKMSFSIAGTTKEYNTLIYVKDTTIHDYKLLNNILAFINTIPSLVTFSVPGYSRYGLEVKNAYANIYTKNNLFHINNLSINSKELDIIGKGTANFKTNKINLNLNLKTDIGSSISKIPLVGYILLGDDNTISTSIQIKGKLDNPEVRSLLAKDIVVAPINILKRALKSPFELFKSKK